MQHKKAPERISGATSSLALASADSFVCNIVFNRAIVVGDTHRRLPRRRRPRTVAHRRHTEATAKLPIPVDAADVAETGLVTRLRTSDRRRRAS